MKYSTSPVADLLLATTMIVTGTVFIIQSLSLPEAPYEPLGPAALPVGVALTCIVLSIVVLIRAAITLAVRRERVDTERGDRTNAIFRGLVTLGAFVWTAAYVAVITSQIVKFSWATMLFVSVLCWYLSGFKRSRLIMSIAISVVVAFGCEFLFTKIFVTNLV